MRLTLRNILAYIDDILEPEDAEEIGKKIQESEFATALVHRTRDVMRRLRVGSPDVLGRGLGLDPNTVAEYLDHSLPEGPVVDFEKICLESGSESDVHLAEVASCHQILALVLGEPADVDPASRERMYQLPKLAESETAPAEASDEVPAAPATVAAKAQPEVLDSTPLPARAGPSVPDWLREELAAAKDQTPIIINAGLELKAEICIATLGLFVRILGGVVGNMALRVFATGGLYIGGGIPPRILSRLEKPDFLEAIRAKGRFRGWISRIPVHVILDPKVALHGAAWDGVEALGHQPR